MTAPSQQRGKRENRKPKPRVVRVTLCRWCDTEGLPPVRAVDRIGRKARICRVCKGVAV